MEPYEHFAPHYLAWLNILAMVHIAGFSCASAYRAIFAKSLALRRHAVSRLIALGLFVVGIQVMVRTGHLRLHWAVVGVIGTCWFLHFFDKPTRAATPLQQPNQPTRVE